MKKITFCAFIFFSLPSLLLATSAMKKEELSVEYAQEAAVIIDGQYLTLRDGIKKALELNPDIYIEKYNALMSDTEKSKFDGQYSPILNMNLTRSSNEYPELLYSQKGKKVDSTTLEASVAKHFSSGTTLVAGFSHSAIDLDPGTVARTYDITSPVAFVSLEQELFKNAFGFGERRQAKILNNVTQTQKEARIFSISLLTLNIVADYWRLAIASNHLDNAELLLNETSSVKKITAHKMGMGLSEKFEINYWNSLEAVSTTKLLQAKQDYNDSLKKFSRDINSDKVTGTRQKVILSEKYMEIDSEEAIKIALEKRFDYRSAKNELENAKMSSEAAQNGTLPSIKAVISASSMDYNSESSSKAYSNLGSRKYPSYSAGINLSYPLDNTSAKTDERNAHMRIKQAEKRLEATERFVRDDVLTKIENIKTSYEIYKNAKRASLEAEEFYKKMLSSFQNGRFSASSVRDAIDAMVSAREGALQTLIRVIAPYRTGPLVVT